MIIWSKGETSSYRDRILTERVPSPPSALACRRIPSSPSELQDRYVVFRDFVRFGNVQFSSSSAEISKISVAKSEMSVCGRTRSQHNAVGKGVIPGVVSKAKASSSSVAADRREGSRERRGLGDRRGGSAGVCLSSGHTDPPLTQSTQTRRGARASQQTPR